MTAADPIPVRTLLGAKGFETSLICLRSLVRFSADPVRLIVHEDGTLTDGHREQLLTLAPGVELVSRKRSDTRVLPLLDRHPRCLAARASGPLFLKLFDIAFLADHHLIYCDSDVFFLRQFRGLFTPPADGHAFMTDACNAYSVRPWKVWPAGPLRLGRRVNTGVIVGPAGIDLDQVEWVLGKLDGDAAYARRPYWAEQTCWAAIAARSGFRLFDPAQVILASANMDGVSPRTVAIHFVSTYRDRLQAFATLPHANNGDVCDIGTRQGRCVSAAGLLWTDVTRRVSSVR